MAVIQWAEDALEQADSILEYIAAAGGDSGSFAKQLYNAVQRLELFPESAPLYAPPVRRLVLHGMSISCYYIYEDDMVKILHVRGDYQLPLGHENP